MGKLRFSDALVVLLFVYAKVICVLPTLPKAQLQSEW